MARLKAILIFIATVTLVLGANSLAAGRKFGTDPVPLKGTSVTTSQTAVFAAFLSNAGGTESVPGGINTAISVSNILAVPEGLSSDFLNIGGSDDTGTVELFMWDRDGTAYSYSSDDPEGPIGMGLNSDGTLGPGQTWTFLLRDVLDRLGLGADASFNGYGWVIGNFDAIAGTNNVVIFDVGFTQAFVMTPAVGQGNSFTGGLPVSLNSDN